MTRILPAQAKGGGRLPGRSAPGLRFGGPCRHGRARTDSGGLLGPLPSAGGPPGLHKRAGPLRAPRSGARGARGAPGARYHLPGRVAGARALTWVPELAVLEDRDDDQQVAQDVHHGGEDQHAGEHRHHPGGPRGTRRLPLRQAEAASPARVAAVPQGAILQHRRRPVPAPRRSPLRPLPPAAARRPRWLAAREGGKAFNGRAGRAAPPAARRG